MKTGEANSKERIGNDGEGTGACPSFLGGFWFALPGSGPHCHGAARSQCCAPRGSCLWTLSWMSLGVDGCQMRTTPQRGEHQQPARGGLRHLKNKTGQGVAPFLSLVLPKAETMKREVTLLKVGQRGCGVCQGVGAQQPRSPQAERKEREATLRDKEMEIGAHKLKAGAREARPRPRPPRALFRCRR